MKDFKFDKNYFEEIEIDLTGSCNLLCDRCSRNYKHSQHLVKKNIRPVNDIINQLNEFKNLKIIMLAGQVSEPTLYPEFLKLLEYLKTRNIIINLYTNASIKNPKLFKKMSTILDKKDSVHFTICGTTQEIHEMYRKGSKLDIILENAASFINHNKNDYLQYIRFVHNLDDLSIFKKIMEANNNKFNMFSNYYIVESEGDRFFNNTIKPRHSLPPKDFFYKKIFNELEKIKTFEPQCRSILWKKIYINQFGEIYPCYSFAEYIKDHFKIDDVYGKINRGEYFCCKLCTKKCSQMMKLYNLDFIC